MNKEKEFYSECVCACREGAGGGKEGGLIFRMTVTDRQCCVGGDFHCAILDSTKLKRLEKKKINKKLRFSNVQVNSKTIIP